MTHQNLSLGKCWKLLGATLRRYFISLVNISFLPLLLASFSSYFKIIKQAPGHNHDNTVYQTGQCPFKFHDNSSSPMRIEPMTFRVLFNID